SNGDALVRADDSSTSTITSSASATSKTTTVIVITASNTYNDGSSSTSMYVLPTYSSSMIAHPTPTIPYTADNPFIHQSSAPEGTVFIAVGSIIGGIVLAVLGWRALVAYSLHKSISQASRVPYSIEHKSGANNRVGTSFFGGNKNHRRSQSNMAFVGRNSTSFYAGGAGSAVSLDQLTSTGRTVTDNRPLTASYDDHSAMPTTAPLFHGSTFYSPTAGAIGMAAHGGATLGASLSPAAGSNRSSTYLPAGFYGAQSSGGAASSTASLTARYSNLTPSHGRSPSPAHIPSRASALNVPPVQGQRVPSAYLDDFLDTDK
ncbi:hypothetical protein V1511DRAFT_445807, partial [Dipodascopsis uninucleata]